MTLKGTVFAVTILLGLLQPNSVVGCKREPRQLPHGAKRAGDHGYHIYIGDDPNGYEPGKIYNGNYDWLHFLRMRLIIFM